MRQSTPSSRQPHSRPLAQLAAVATLTAFLVAQSWIACAPLCLLEGHGKVAMVASHYRDHLLHCHSNRVVASALPAIQSLGAMLPVGGAPLLPPSRMVSIRFAPPAPVHLQQIPLADPPPPRSV
jgi:hypothetical protein